MKRMALLGMMVSATWACSASPGGAPAGTEQAAILACPANQTVYYSKVTPPSAGENGASGVAAAPAVLNGSGGSGGSSSGGGSEGVDTPSAPSTPSTPAGTTTASPAPTPTPSPASTAPFASTAASCVPSVCSPGEVAVQRLSPTGSSGGASGGVGSAPVVSPPSGEVDPPATTGSGTTTITTSPAPTATTLPAAPAPSPTPTPAPTATTTPAPDPGDVICTAPPPACPAGQAPSYAPAGFWHCMPLCDPTNANLVVISYGGVYGNGGVCASPPPVTSCPVTGQVWTWNFLIEAWDCEAECNNGQYDQHTFGNQVVCIPC